MPATTAAAASRKEPLWRNTVAAMKAPIMYSEPCARLMKFMMPNTSVRPAASRPGCAATSPASNSSQPATRHSHGRRAAVPGVSAMPCQRGMAVIRKPNTKKGKTP